MHGLFRCRNRKQIWRLEYASSRAQGAHRSGAQGMKHVAPCCIKQAWVPGRARTPNHKLS